MARPPEKRDKEIVFCYNCPLDDCNARNHTCPVRIYNSAGLSLDEAYQIARLTIDSDRYKQYERAIITRSGKRYINPVALGAYVRTIKQERERRLFLAEVEKCQRQ
jgi:hypothetical protein